ncbi:MAG: carbohydrate ABC transporter permease [Chloroflexota bacterium]
MADRASAATTTSSSLVAPGASPVTRRWSARRWRDARDGYLFILPWLLGFILWTGGPMIASVAISMTEWRIITTPHFVGLGNFLALLHDSQIGLALYNSAFYVVFGVPTHIFIATLAALAVNVRLRGVAFYRTLYFLPSLTPIVANSLLWLTVFNTDFGLANFAISFLGLPPVQWLSDPRFAKDSLIVMSWWGMGAQMVILLAGLNGIPDHLYDAAAIDGASWWDRFWHVTLPMLSPAIFFNLIIALIGAFQVFTQAYIMTNGGPDNATLFYVYYLYQVAFQNFDMGYASAMAWLFFLIILAFTLIQFKAARRWVFYEAELKR